MQDAPVKILEAALKAEASLQTSECNRILKLAHASETAVPVQNGTQPKTKGQSNLDSFGDHDRNFKQESQRNKKLRFCKPRMGNEILLSQK
jgi:hypothetical protein